MPVSFVPLALGIVLSLPAVLAAGTFHRPEWSWFSTPVQSLRTAVGCAILLGLARLAWRHPTRGIAVLFPAFFILMQTAFSWDFGMTLQAHWHDTILAPLWIVGSALAGLSLLLLLCAARPCEPRFGADDFDRLGCFMLAFCLLHGYFLYAQTLTVWYGNLPAEVGAMRERLTGSFSTLFWIIVAVTIAAPILLLIFRPVRRSPWASTLIAAAVLIGLWLERVWIVLPARPLSH
jgi:Ni/Fe-hydrogenase subunit HybB-like protein